MLKRLLQNLTLLCLLLAGTQLAAAAPADWIIKGAVTDKNGKPIESASITVKNQTKGTETDKDGKFTITVPENSTLIISAIGFQSTELVLKNDKEVFVTLEQASKGLEEVVVVGYGTQKKGEVTSSIATVSSKNLEKQPAANLGTLLQGQAAGVSVSTSSGNPAGTPSVLIRGMNSINNDKPLYVVDGVPASDMYDLNPNDIETINILKDASAATIYGARAAGGVIIITTKKGKSGEPRINFNGYWGSHKINNNIPLLDKVGMNKVVRKSLV